MPDFEVAPRAAADPTPARPEPAELPAVESAWLPSGPRSEAWAAGDAGQPVDQLHRSGQARRGWSARQVATLQRTAGNRAVSTMLAGVVQRDGGVAPSAPAVKAKAPKTSKAPTSSFNSYVDLMNGFQELAAAALNRGGAGLDTVRFGRDLSPAHRSLLAQVRAVLIQAQDQNKDSRIAASAAWPALAARLQVAVTEATRWHAGGEALAAVTDDIALLGTKYVHAAQGKAAPEVETGEDYGDTINGMGKLLYEFSQMGESSEGLQQEEVTQRKDAAVSMAVSQGNANQRDALTKIQFGSHLNRRHAKVLDELRKALVLARTEAPGSAYQAYAKWRSIQGELQHVLKRAPTFIEADVGTIQGLFDAAAGVIARHYSVVYQQTLRVALTKERSPEQLKLDRARRDALSPAVAKAMDEQRVLEDFGYALTIIEQHLAPSSAHSGEWVLTSGGTVVRVRGDKVVALRATAGAALKTYMADITKVMVAAWQTYDSIKQGNSSLKLHILGGYGGATDPGSQEDTKTSVMRVRDTIVYPLVDQGKYAQAFKMIMAQKGVVEQHAKEVGDYDSDLDTGYSRLATSMKVVQVALVSLVPVAGEAAMATTMVGGVAVEGASVWAVGGTAIASGGVGAGAAETGRELVTEGKVDPGKIGKATYSGALIGGSAVAPAATRNLGSVLAAGGEGTTLVGANALAAGGVGWTQSLLGGGGGVESFAAGAFGSLAGSATKGLGTFGEAPVTNIAVHGGIGAGVGLIAGDPLAGLVGGISSAIGGATVAPPAGGGGGTTPPAPGGDAGKTIPGVGIAPRPPAAPTAGETLPGVGIPARPPAAGGGAGETIPGVGVAPRSPAGPAAGETIPGVGVPPRAPAPSEGEASPASGPASPNPARGGDTQDSIAPAPRPGNQPVRRGGFAAAPEYAGRPPVMGRVAYIVDNADEAAALYVRLNQEGQRNILGSSDPDLELDSWQTDGGQGEPPMAWVRASDGVVRFSFSRFQRPNLGGYSSEPVEPIDYVPARSSQPPSAPRPADQRVIREYARLPEHASSAPLYGPNSKVTYVITDPQEAQQTWSRLVGERQLNILEHDEDFVKMHWSDDGGVGEVPIAWVRSGDGVIRFNLARFTRPTPPQAPPQ